MPSPSSRTLLAAGAAFLAAGAFASQAGASSDSAWTQFRTDVEASCRAAAEGVLDESVVTVDPFGSEHFGLAVLTGRETGGDATRSVVCVYDKTAKTAEIGGLLDLAAGAPQATTAGAADAVALEAEAGAPFGGRCAEECEASLSLLSDTDREELIDLPDRLRRTLASIDPIEEDGGTKVAVEAVQLVAEDGATADMEDGAPVALDPGEAECTLRWFGFMDEGARTVGSHRCRIAKGEDGSLTVEKLTGERLLVTLSPLTDRLFSFRGRSFLPDQPERAYDLKQPVNAGNTNFGNVVGLATMSGGQLHLIGGNELGMEPPDRNFFSVLTISHS